ncbi:MAG: DUF2891 domain-containing protein [bacterium]
MKRTLSFFVCIVCFTMQNCTNNSPNTTASTQIERTTNEVILDINEANRLIELPLNCIQNPLPYKSGLVVAKESDLAMPEVHHPAFYGCFDWHSAVHGHWSLVYLLKNFPDLAKREEAIRMLDENLTAENIAKEVAYFTMNNESKSFERTYGWAWLLKLQEELYTWDDPMAKKWYDNIKPLEDYISKAYIDYLPKLVYPIRVGEHSNSAFGMSFSYDYAITVGNDSLAKAIKEAALRFYSNDKDCPISWEPSGYDFLSPCLQEIDIMRKILTTVEFAQWSKVFLPELYNQKLELVPGQVKDRSDGKLVHLDGVNFSRAWCLYPVAKNNNAYNLATEHFSYSLKKITDGDYAGQHWLASFALYAFKTKKELEESNNKQHKN